MASKKGKKKLTLGEFYQKVGRPRNERDLLPTAPMPKEEREQERYERDQRRMGSGMGAMGPDGEMGASRAEEDDQWRRGPSHAAPAAAGAGRGGPGGFGGPGGPGGFGGPGGPMQEPRREDDGPWRRAPPAGGPEGPQGPQGPQFGRSDDVDQWRRAPAPDAEQGPRIGRSDGDDKWRRGPDPHDQQQQQQQQDPRFGRSDDDTAWRRSAGRSTQQQEPDAGPPQGMRADSAGAWRSQDAPRGGGGFGDRGDRFPERGGGRGFGDRFDRGGGGGYNDRGRGGFDRDGGRGFGGGFDRDGGRGGYGGPRGGGFDGPRGGGFDGPRGGGFDRPRGGGFDGPRGGGFDGPRGGGFDGPRGGGFDRPRGGFDGPRGGYEDRNWGSRRGDGEPPASGGYKRLNLTQRAGKDGNQENRPQNSEDSQADAAPAGQEASAKSQNADTDTPVEAQEQAQPAPVTAPEPKVEEKPKPVFKPKNVKKFDPNAKFDPFGGARPVDKGPKIEPKAVAEIRKPAAAEGTEPSKPAQPAAGRYVPPNRKDPFSGARARDTGEPLAPMHPARMGHTQQRGLGRGRPGSRGDPSLRAPVLRKVEAKEDDTVAVLTKKTFEDTLEYAVKERQSVSLELLQEELAELDVGKTEDLRSRLGASIASSLQEEKLTFEQALEVLRAECKEHVPSVITHTLEAYKSSKGEDGLKAFVKQTGVDITSVVGTLSADLACLASGSGNLEQEVEDAFKANKTGAEVMQLVKASTGGKIDPSFLAPSVVSHTFAKVFEEKKQANMEPLESFAKLIQLVTKNNLSAQVATILAAHKAWHAGGAGKGLIKNVFQKLHELKCVPPQAFLEWKSDLSTKKVPGKGKALIQNLKFLGEMEQAIKASQRVYEDEDEDEDDDLVEDPYLQNYNRPVDAW